MDSLVVQKRGFGYELFIQKVDSAVGLQMSFHFLGRNLLFQLEASEVCLWGIMFSLEPPGKSYRIPERFSKKSRTGAKHQVPGTRYWVLSITYQVLPGN